jgi:hypothetical protein
LDAASVQTAPDGYRLIVWMIVGMIRAHPTENRMPRQAVLIPPFTCFAQPDVLFDAGEWTATGIDLMPGQAPSAVEELLASRAAAVQLAVG